MSQFGLNFRNEIAAGSWVNALVALGTIRQLQIPFSHLAERRADDREPPSQQVWEWWARAQPKASTRPASDAHRRQARGQLLARQFPEEAREVRGKRIPRVGEIVVG